MKLQFKVQEYQTEAVDAVVDCFGDQPRQDGISYRIDPGAVTDQLDLDRSGLRNAEIALTEPQLLANIQAVQAARHLPASSSLAPSKAARVNLDVEMETGTGKTYVYIKTMMELHRRYGWSKYIIVVPSIAIREGVKKSFEVTAEHFQQEFGTKPRVFIYNSSRLHEIEGFSSDSGVQVMIINIQAFNATGKDARRIYEVLDEFQSRKPIDVIAANRPIVVIDEPQKIGEKSLEALGKFNALFCLRYSATHRVEHNKVHRLDAVDAYNQKLVKRIAVRGITVKGLAGSTAYLYLQGIEVAKGKPPTARVELEAQTGSGIKRTLKRLTKGANLHDLSGGIEAYHGLFITNVDATSDIIELSTGQVVEVGQVTEDIAEDAKRRIQIREVIAAHLDKERELFGQGIKVLSLFFIDEVAKYRDYSREDTLGEYARIFEEEYKLAVADYLNQLPDEDSSAFRTHLESIDVRQTHQGYFSIDKRSKHLVDPHIVGRGEDKGLADDVDAYDLILKDKERLLSFAEPVRFIFSHSALREGWDNPNVFTMGMLKHSDNTVSRRQEIGRGLRIAVNQDGERMDNPATVHQINELTVVTDESYTAFVDGLQKEIVESLSSRPRKATPEFFAGRMVEIPDGSGTKVAITIDQAKQLQHWLTVNGLIDYEQQLTEKWFTRSDYDLSPMPAGLNAFHHQVSEIIDSLNCNIPEPVDGRKPKLIPINEANFQRREFQELWRRISPKAVYQVDFDSNELISKCVVALDAQLKVAALQYIVQKGQQAASLEADDLASGKGFSLTATQTSTETVTASSQVKYDLLGEIAGKTELTRRTVAAILGKVRPTTFALYRQNPEQFISEAARLIGEQKATVVIEHLTYDVLSETHDTAIFTQNQTRVDFAKTVDTPNRHIYERVVADSNVERKFAADLDVSSEVVVYAKLPHGFLIPTPVGDYNPDWAIAFQEGTVQHVYFVAETKGSPSREDLRYKEEARIECARKFFARLSEVDANEVTYDVITDYGQLMSLIGASA